MAREDMYEATCPKCGRHLVLREGAHGEFLACPDYPRCKYTQPTKDGDKPYCPSSPYCEKCGYTGLLPFIKNGKTIPNAWIDCECKKEEIGHYHRVTPADFDFPISYDYYRSLCQEHGWPDPGADRPSIEKVTPHQVTIKADPRVDQLEGQLVSLRDNLKQHVIESKSKYKGAF